MGTKLRVLRRFHYPSGPTGRDYNPGEEMEVVSERDAKALTLIRMAELMPAPASAPAPKPTQARAEPQEEAPRSETREEEPKKPVQPLTTADMPSETSDAQPRRRYRRSDMVAEEE